MFYRSILSLKYNFKDNFESKLERKISCPILLNVFMVK